MIATDDELREVCAVLHSRGREATPEQVKAWLAKFCGFYRRNKGLDISESSVCRLVVKENPTVTMCLHIHFGDAL